VRFIDANLFIRYLTRDDIAKADACFEVFQRLRRGDEQATTSEAVIAEIAYVLKSRTLYALSPNEIRIRLLPLLTVRGLRLPHRAVIIRALDYFAASSSLDFEDALSVAHMERLGITEIYTYDRDFDRIAGVTRLEP
jgi:predicted nucleic acid-binding protein